MERIFSAVQAYADEASKLRRDFHKFAEDAWCEYRTTAQIAQYLRRIGVPCKLGVGNMAEQFAYNRPEKETLEKAKKRAEEQGVPKELIEEIGDFTGVTAVIDSGKPGKTYALRFDIDALTLTESKTESHRPWTEGFASVNDGACHACGHDGHTAIGLICARILNENKDSFCGKVKLVFQPAEEGVCGARAMMESGFFDDVDVLLSGHIGLNAKENGLLVANTGGFFATAKQKVVFKGKSAHAAAAPEKGKNALLAAASAALNVYPLVQDSRGMARVNVGTLHAGTVANVIPERAEMKIEGRAMTTELCDELSDNIKRVCEAAAMMYGVQVETTIFGAAMGANGDESLEKKLCAVARKYNLAEKIKEKGVFGASEDVSWMMDAVQKRGGVACYMMWGTELAEAHHNSMFDFDEKVLPFAIKILLAAICEGI